jgi:predicted CopG family antitoxin
MIKMTSKQISIRKEVYERLYLQKKENESFSDVIIRLLDKQSNFHKIEQCFGLSKDLPDEFVAKFRESSKEMRKKFMERFNTN